MFFLGIETSCDETGLAIYSPQRGVVAEHLASSSEQHQQTNGIVPEVAARDHSRQLLRLFAASIADAKITAHDITAIGYTRGPGLMGALMVGTAFAKSLALALGKPCLGIHHLEGHLAVVDIESGCEAPHTPYLALLVSGGHTHLFQVEKNFSYRLVGATRDDAAGEAFDKCAAMLGLGYPGGAALARLAEKGDAKRFFLPRPMQGKPGYDFSFSGLKTAVRYCIATLGNQVDDPQTRADLAAGIEEAIIDSLVMRLTRAVTHTGIHRVVIAGGVSANLRLREAVAKTSWDSWFPPPRLCTDNGIMIARAAAARYQAKLVDQDQAIAPLAVWLLST